MIMKTNKWILGGLMAMAITACTSDELVENNLSTESGKGQLVSVTAYTPGNGNSSRVAPTDKPNEGVRVVSLTWEDNENFTVIGTEHTTFNNGEDGGNTFTGYLPLIRRTDQNTTMLSIRHFLRIINHLFRSICPLKKVILMAA